MHFRNWTFLFILLVLYSCEFEPHGEFFPDVTEPNSAPQITVDLNMATDTIIVELSNTLTFNFQSDEAEVHWVKLYIDDNACGTYNQNSGSFSITTQNCGNSIGTHKMTIEAYTGSGTGSIADVLGLEGFLFSKTWILIVKERWSYNPKVKYIKPDNGSLKLGWEKFKGFDFKEYVVLKSSDHNHYFDTLALVKNQHITSIYDPGYIGEDVYYRVDVHAANGRDYRGVGMKYKDTVPQVYIGNINNQLVTLNWDNSKFINNIQGYEVYVRNPQINQYEMIAEVNNENATSCVIDSLQFAFEIKFILVTLPKKMPSYLDDLYHKLYSLGSATEGFIGDKYNGGTIITPIGDFLYYKSQTAIYEYNYVTEEITDSIECYGGHTNYFSVSPNRKYILILKDSKTVVYYNIETKDSKTYTVQELTGNPSGLYFPAISDNGIGVIELAYSNTLVYDFINDKKIFQNKLGYASSKFTISAGGKYFYKTNGHLLFEIQSDTIFEIWENATEIANSSLFNFDPNNESLIVTRNEDYINTRSINDLSIVSSCHIPDAQIINIDYNSNKVFGCLDNKFRLYDMATGAEIWSYPAYGNSYYTVHFCYNTIYYGREGLKLKIE